MNLTSVVIVVAVVAVVSVASVVSIVAVVSVVSVVSVVAVVSVVVAYGSKSSQCEKHSIYKFSQLTSTFGDHSFILTTFSLDDVSI